MLCIDFPHSEFPHSHVFHYQFPHPRFLHSHCLALNFLTIKIPILIFVVLNCGFCPSRKLFCFPLSVRSFSPLFNDHHIFIGELIKISNRFKVPFCWPIWDNFLFLIFIISSQWHTWYIHLSLILVSQLQWSTWNKALIRRRRRTCSRRSLLLLGAMLQNVWVNWKSHFCGRNK